MENFVDAHALSFAHRYPSLFRMFGGGSTNAYDEIVSAYPTFVDRGQDTNRRKM